MELDLFSFYQKLLPSDGVYCLSEIFYSEQYNRQICVNRGYSSLDELVRQTNYFEARHLSSDIYFAVAAYNELATHDPVTGRDKFRRTSDNVRAGKCLYVDLDVKPEAFPSQESATRHMRQACDVLGLPHPMLVNSGSGVHCYFPLDTEVDGTTLRKMLRALQLKLGEVLPEFAIDGLVDSTRILRPIGTTNKKTIPAKPVTLLYDAVPISLQLMLNVLGPLPEIGAVGNVTVGEPEGKLSSYQIVTECQQVRECGTQVEPVWRAGLSVLRLCKHGREAAHYISSLDPRYRPEDTDAKLNVLNEQQGVEGMPATCMLFNSLRPNICQSCQYWPSVMRGEIKSPAVFGRQNPPPPPPLPKLEEYHFPGLPASTLPSTPSIPSTPSYESPLPEPAPTPAPAFVPPSPSPYAPSKPVGLGDWSVPALFTPLVDRPIDTSPNTRFLCRTPLNTNIADLVGTVMYVSNKNGDEPVEIYLSSDVMVPIACSQMKNDDGNWEQSTVWRIYSRYKKDFVDVSIKNSDLHSADAIKKISSFGVTIENAKHFTPFTECLRGLLMSARTQLPVKTAFGHLGWVDNDTFSLGTIAYRRLEGGVIEPIQLTKNDDLAPVIEYFGSDGDLQTWVDAFNVFGRKGNEHMAFAALATFGAPLMRFTHQNGLTIAIVTPESGTGKSTMQRVSMAAWGNPRGLVKHQLGPSSGITMNAFMSFMSLMHSLPVQVDEISKMPDDQVGSMLYMLSSGEERQRATSSGKIRISSGKWGTITVMSSNKSLREQISSSEMRESDAMHKRLIELAPPPVTRSSDEWIAAAGILDKVGPHNYGLAGNLFAQFLVANLPILEDKVSEKIRYLVAKGNGEQSERFWFAAVACIFVGAELAQAAGLHNYDLPHLEDWFFETLLPDMRISSSETQTNGESLLAEILSDYLRETLVVRSHELPANEAAKVGYAIRTPAYSAVYVRAEVKEQRVFISTDALRKWAARNKYQLTTIVNAFETAGLLKSKSVRIYMGRGVSGLESMAGTRLRCVELSIDPMKYISEQPAEEMNKNIQQK